LIEHPIPTSVAFSDRYVMGGRGNGAGQINWSGQCRDNDNEDEPAIFAGRRSGTLIHR
jgi:hypothetical protein